MFRSALLLSVLVASVAAAQAVAPMTPPMRPPAVRPVVNEPYFPTPGSTPAGAGAYVPTSDGNGVHVPQSPNKRILPATKEVGLWAADGAQGAATTMPAIFDIALPYPVGATTPDAQWWSNVCGRTMTDAAKRKGTDVHFAGLSMHLRQCLAAKSYLRCAEGIRDLFKGGARPNRVVDEMQAHANALVKYNCLHPDLVSPHAEALRELFAEWEARLPDAMTSIPNP
jgi:hypothetical protein